MTRVALFAWAIATLVLMSAQAAPVPGDSETVDMDGQPKSIARIKREVPPCKDRITGFVCEKFARHCDRFASVKYLCPKTCEVCD